MLETMDAGQELMADRRPPTAEHATDDDGRTTKDDADTTSEVSSEAGPVVEAPPKPKRTRRKKAKTDETVVQEAAAAPDVTETVAEIEPTVAELQVELGEQVEAVVERMQAEHPEYTPPPYSPQALADLAQRTSARLVPRRGLALLQRASEAVGAGNLTDPDTLKGLWYMLNYTAQYQGDILKRRVTGEYTTDAYGYDPEFNEVIKPLIDFLYGRYWRVTVNGMENVPEEGAAVLVSNRGGALPWDAVMIGQAVQREHVNARLVRPLYANYLRPLPFVSVVFTKMGMLVAHPDNGRRLLREGELVLVFPEGYRGPSKLFRDRYHLARFSQTSFARLAVETGAPLIPVSVVGSEETYPVIGRADVLGKPLGLPYFPLTPFWPWTGPLGLIPLPSKWAISFGAPISTANLDADATNDEELLTRLTEDIRAQIQQSLYDGLKERKSVFFG